MQKAIDQPRKNAPHMTHKTQRIGKTPIYNTKITSSTKDTYDIEDTPYNHHTHEDQHKTNN